MTEQEQRVPVSTRAVIGRINRRIKRHGQRLVASRGDRQQAAVGQYCLVSTETGRLIETHVDLEKLARREYALGLWEEISNQKAGET